MPWACGRGGGERAEQTQWPVWVALLEGRVAQRLAATDGTTGAADQRLSAILTYAMTYVRNSLR